MTTISSGLRLAGVGLVIGCVALSGCNRVPRGRVSGKVTLNGKSLETRVLVNFKCADNNVLSAWTLDSGEYSLEAVPVGPVTVTVTPPGGDASAADGPGRGRVKADERPAVPKRGPPPRTVVPVEYMDASNPLLKDEVKEGNNLINLDLRSPAR